jgi:hypothetical protein
VCVCVCVCVCDFLSFKIKHRQSSVRQVQVSKLICKYLDEDE